MLGEKLAQYRQMNNISIEELALSLDVSEEVVIMWEKEELTPTLEQLITIANKYNVSLDDIVGRKVKGKKKEGYFARAYLKYDNNVYYRFSNVFLDGNIKKYLILAIVSFVIAFLSLIFEAYVVLGISLFIGIFSLLLRRSLKKNKEIFISNTKSNNPGLEHYIWFYENKIELTEITKNGKCEYILDKSDVTKVKCDGRYIYVIARGLYFIIDKKMCDGNLDKIISFLNIKNDKNINKHKINKAFFNSTNIHAIINN